MRFAMSPDMSIQPKKPFHHSLKPDEKNICLKIWFHLFISSKYDVCFQNKACVTMTSKGSTLYVFFLRCWWAILLILLSYAVYLHGMHKKKQMYSTLTEKVNVLEKQLCVALEKREELLLQMSSQSDPAWTEILLKKHLGMVPYGQTKVYFEEQ
jgi:hypothetical protein